MYIDLLGLHGDIILCTICKTRLHVVSGTFSLPIPLVSIDIDVISFLLVEHNHAFGTLDALVRLAFAPHWGLSWCEGAGGGFDVGDPAVNSLSYIRCACRGGWGPKERRRLLRL